MREEDAPPPEGRREEAAVGGPGAPAAVDARAPGRAAKGPVVPYVVTLGQAPEVGRRHHAAGAWRLPAFESHAARRAFDRARQVAALSAQPSL